MFAVTGRPPRGWLVKVWRGSSNSLVRRYHNNAIGSEKQCSPELMIVDGLQVNESDRRVINTPQHAGLVQRAGVSVGRVWMV